MIRSGITALRSWPLAGPAFLPVVSCSGIAGRAGLPGMPECRKPGMPEYRDTGIPEYRNTGIPECRDAEAGVPGRTGILARGELLRHYGITALRSGPLAGPAFLPVVSCSGIAGRAGLTGMPGYRNTGIPEYRNAGIPGYRILNDVKAKALSSNLKRLENVIFRL